MKSTIIAVLVTMNVYATPVIQKAEVVGDEMTITGTSLGSGPHVVVYDNFERGTDGASIPAGPATVGAWTGTGSAAPKFAKGTGAFGTGYFKATYATTWLEYLEAKVGPNATNVYLSYHWRVPEGKLFPGENSADKLNWKVIWLMNAGTTSGDVVLPVFVESPTNILITGNDTPYGKYPAPPELPVKGPWHHYQFATKASATTGSMEMWETTTAGVLKRVSDLSKPTVYEEDTWNLIHVPGYGRSYPGQEVNIDEFYLADGPSAKARVALGNNASYAQSSSLKIAPPISWTSTAIKVKSQAGLEYVTVFDSAGNPSNTVKVGGGTPVPIPVVEKYPFSMQVSTGILLKGEIEVTK